MGKLSDRRRGSDRTKVRKCAQQSQAGSKGIPFTLPANVEEWEPEEKGTVGMHILPYVVSRKGHPDGIKVGEPWYKRPFKVHTHVGPEDINLVCPTSVGQRCPLCEEAKRLGDKDWKANEEDIKKLRAKNFAAYNISLDGETVKVFAVSVYKFSEMFEQELAEGSEKNACFDDPDEGKLVNVRFAEEDYLGHKFFKAARFDFEDRDPISDELLKQVVDLDAALIVKDYDTIHDLLFGIETPTKDSKDEDAAPTETEEEEAPPPPPAPKRKDEQKQKPAPQKAPPKEEPVEDDIPMGDDEIPEADQCPACEGTGKTSKGNTCPICTGTGRKGKDKDKAAAPSKPAPTKKPAPKKEEPAEEEAGEDGEDWGDLDWEDDKDK